MDKNLLKKYYSRVRKEGYLKSALYGMLVGFIALVIASALFWAFGWSQVWICAIVWVISSAVGAYAFYQFKFKINSKKVASKIDALGLEERIITMVGLEGDDSYIAVRQRQDAKEALEKIEPSVIPVKISRPFIYKFALALVGTLACVSVAVLSSVGVIPSLKQLIEKDQIEQQNRTYSVVYEIKEGDGKILGNAEQEVEYGKDATPVAAVAGDGWVFVRWSDNLDNAYRQDGNITRNVVIYALFETIDTGRVGELGDELPDDAPTIEESGTSNDTSNDEYGDEVNGKFEEVNQVIDGKTYYGNVYEESYKDAMEQLNGNDYSDDEKQMGSGYFDSIAKTEQKQEEDGN